MYESGDIVRYLFNEYGTGSVPLLYSIGPLFDATSALASAWRLGAGVKVEPSKPPVLPLELWSFEASPFCRIVRETLCTLEIPYHLRNVGKSSPSRDAFVERSGKMQVPFLADPNTQVELFESADIVRYLRATYGS
jgi:glutaredoxin